MAQKVADPCRNCGAAVPPGAAFCTLCGATVTNRATAPTPSSVPLGGSSNNPFASPGGAGSGSGRSPFAGGHGGAQGNANAGLAPTITPGLAPGGTARDGRASNDWGGQTPNSQQAAVPGIIPVGMGTTGPLVAPQQVGVDPRIAAATALAVGGAGRRLAAKIIDGVLPSILLGVAAGVGALMIKTTPVGDVVEVDLTWLLILTGIASLLSVGYGIWLWLWEARSGKTPGNLMLGLRTTNMDGQPAGLLAIFLRYLIIGVSGIIPTIGPLLVIISNTWDSNDKKQGWHDKVAHTLVFNVKKGRDPLETGGIAERENFVPAAVPTISEVRSPLARPATNPAAAGQGASGQGDFTQGAFMQGASGQTNPAPGVSSPGTANGAASPAGQAAGPADTPTRGGRRRKKKNAIVDPFAPPVVQFQNQQNQQNQPFQGQWGQLNPQSQNQQFQNQPGQQDQGQQFPGQQEQQFQNQQFQGQQGQPQQGWQSPGQAAQQNNPFASPSAADPRTPVDQGPITSVPGVIRNTQPEPGGQQFGQAQQPQQSGQPQQQQNFASGPNPVHAGPPAQTGHPAFSAPPPAPPAAGPSTARPSSIQSPATGSGEEAGETRVRPVAQNPALRLTFDDGRSEDISTVALIGRNPAGYDGEMISRLISIQDSSRSVSKTHLHLRVAGDGLWVTDRNSTNGSAVTSTAGATMPLTGGSPALAEVGSKVHFGDRSFVVGHA